MTAEAREELRRRASERGWTMQAYLEHLLLGVEDPEPLPSGRPIKHPELPLTG